MTDAEKLKALFDEWRLRYTEFTNENSSLVNIGTSFYTFDREGHFISTGVWG